MNIGVHAFDRLKFKMCNHCGEQYGGSRKKLKIELLDDAAISLLGIDPEKTMV